MTGVLLGVLLSAQAIQPEIKAPKPIPWVLVTSGMSSEEANKLRLEFALAPLEKIKRWADGKGFILHKDPLGICMIDPHAVGLEHLQVQKEVMTLLTAGTTSKPLKEMGALGQRFIQLYGKVEGAQGWDLVQAEAQLQVKVEFQTDSDHSFEGRREIAFNLEGAKAAIAKELHRSQAPVAPPPPGPRFAGSLFLQQQVLTFNLRQEINRAKLRAAAFNEILRLTTESKKEADLLYSQVLMRSPGATRAIMERLRNNGPTSHSDFGPEGRQLLKLGFHLDDDPDKMTIFSAGLRATIKVTYRISPTVQGGCAYEIDLTP